MSDQGLRKHSDVEELTAWMDGELDAARAERVARRVAGDADWQATHEDFRAVDAALERVPAARLQKDLTDRIVRAAHRRRLTARLARGAAAAAAVAACVLLVVFVARRTPPPSPQAETARSALELKIDRVLHDVPAEDREMVQMISVLQNLTEVRAYQAVEEVVDAATLDALVSLEAGEGL